MVSYLRWICNKMGKRCYIPRTEFSCLRRFPSDGQRLEITNDSRRITLQAHSYRIRNLVQQQRLRIPKFHSGYSALLRFQTQGFLHEGSKYSATFTRMDAHLDNIFGLLFLGRTCPLWLAYSLWPACPLWLAPKKSVFNKSVFYI